LILRGRFVTVALPGAYGKPRPALVVQSNLFAKLPSLVVCPLTTTLRQDADLIRIEIEPSPDNGLRQVSQIAVDKIAALPLEKIGAVIGTADASTMLRVDRALAVFLGLV
jgi:mRNA interferase MazF